MTAIQARHDLTPDEIDAIEDAIYDHNRRAVGRDDAEGLGFVIHDDAGRLIGAVAGYSWAASSEISQLWVDQTHRGKGYGLGLLHAFIDEAAIRGVQRIWVESYSFQAPELYERAGFVRMADFADWPPGHSNVILCKTL